MFSSPGKQAQQAASASNAMSQQDIQQLEQYVTGQQQQLRGAIQGQGPNPFFGAAQQVNPSMYAVNPNDTVSFGSQGPGTYTVQASQPTTPPQIQKPPVSSNPNPKPPQQTPGPLPINPAQPIQKSPPVNNPLPNPVGTPKPGPPSAGPYPKDSPRTNPVLGNEPRGIGRTTL